MGLGLRSKKMSTCCQLGRGVGLGWGVFLEKLNYTASNQMTFSIFNTDKGEGECRAAKWVTSQLSIASVGKKVPPPISAMIVLLHHDDNNNVRGSIVSMVTVSK